ncbi:uncharacterized protein LOC128552927, partial [Mercenaria mercenaria]|uniref:uncharacterized protein LOC128552927 n=1 Tax=Mercenaria mercenaria TaxID=6596 RepID=UPI00234F03AE
MENIPIMDKTVADVIIEVHGDGDVNLPGDGDVILSLTDKRKRTSVNTVCGTASMENIPIMDKPVADVISEEHGDGDAILPCDSDVIPPLTGKRKQTSVNTVCVTASVESIPIMDKPVAAVISEVHLDSYAILPGDSDAVLPVDSDVILPLTGKRKRTSVNTVCETASMENIPIMDKPVADVISEVHVDSDAILPGDSDVIYPPTGKRKQTSVNTVCETASMEIIPIIDKPEADVISEVH